MDVDNGNKRVFNRLGGGGGGPSSGPQSQKVCYFWKLGNCYKNPCPYLHGEPNHQNNNFQQPKRLQQDDRNNVSSSQQTFARRKPNPTYNNSTQQMSSKWGRGHGGAAGGGFRPPQKVPDRVCHFWLSGKCKFGDTCKFQHPAFLGEGFSMLTQLTGHSKVISGISFPLGSDKLYSGSKDESVRVWDCQTGQCSAVVNLASEVGCMINEGPWIFVGVPDAVKAWNTQTNTELSLNGPVGQVYALVVGNGMLFAGTQDGNILVWKYNAATNTFDPAASLMGHSRSVVSLVVGANRLYSGSMDHTIRVWDLDTLQCIETLKEHTSVVMSVLCWEQFLLSCSLDQTIKVWVASESGSLEVTYTHTEEHGVLALCGMHDAQAKPVLLCSCNDNTVRLYDLPSFNERGKIFSKEETRAIQVGPGGLFFTGDGTGELKVWKWSDA